MLEAHEIDIDDCEHEAGEIARVLFFFDPLFAALEAENARLREAIQKARISAANVDAASIQVIRRLDAALAATRDEAEKSD